MSDVEHFVNHGPLICLGQVGAMEPLGYFDPAGFCKVGDKAWDPVGGGVLQRWSSHGPAMLDVCEL